MLTEYIHQGLALPKCVSEHYGINASPGVLDDPFGSQTFDQMELKEDKSDIVIEAGSCVRRDNYAAKTAEANQVMRLVWTLPLAQITTAGQPAKIDQRGLLTDITSAVVTFTNQLDETISIRGNSPRAYTKDLSLVGTRDCNLSRDVGPHKSVSIRIPLGVTAVFAPLIYSVKDASRLKLLVMALYDFCVISPNVSLDTGSILDSARAVCKVHFDVKYTVNSDAREGTTSVFREPFRMQALASLSDLFTVDGLVLSSRQGILTPYAKYLAPRIVQAELSAEKWIRLELYKHQGDYSYKYRLVYCDAKGAYHAKVQFREYQGSDYRLAFPGVTNGFVRHFAGTSTPAGVTYGTSTLRWDEDDDCWTMTSARTTVQGDISNVGTDGPDDIVPATSPFIVFSVSPPLLAGCGTMCRGGQLIMLRHPDDIVIGGVITDVIKVVHGATIILRAFAAALSLFA